MKRRIFEGDVYQLQLGIRFGAALEGEAFDLYRALRRHNPSPYMFYVDTAFGAAARRFAGVSRAFGGASRAFASAGRHALARARRRRGRADCGGAARQRKGARRARDARRSRAKRPRLGLRVRQRQRRRAAADRALQPRHAHRLERRRPLARRLRCARSLPRRIPGGHGYRDAEDSRDAAHRRVWSR